MTPAGPLLVARELRKSYGATPAPELTCVENVACSRSRSRPSRTVTSRSEQAAKRASCVTRIPRPRSRRAGAARLPAGVKAGPALVSLPLLWRLM
jgi:hypothetical protein